MDSSERNLAQRELGWGLGGLLCEVVFNAVWEREALCSHMQSPMLWLECPWKPLHADSLEGVVVSYCCVSKETPVT